MPARWLPPVLILLALLLGGVLEVAWGQGLPVQGLERLSPEERQVVERNRERWERLAPEERQRVLENQERWRQMSPEERDRLRERWRSMPPEERARLRERLHPPREGPGAPPARPERSR